MFAHRTLAAAVSTLGLAVLAAAVVALPGNAAQITRQSPAAAAPLVDGITVTATGSATVDADTIAVQLRARARSKTVGQALEDFRAKRTLLDKVLADFEDVGLVSESGGVHVGLKQADANAFIMDDQPTAPPFEAVEIVTVRFSSTDRGLDTVVALIEAASDVDCELNANAGLNPYVVFYGAGDQNAEPVVPVAYVASAEALQKARETAMERAYADALLQAEALATIAGRKIRTAEAIRVVKPFPDVTETSGPGKRNLTLTVRFSLE